MKPDGNQRRVGTLPSIRRLALAIATAAVCVMLFWSSSPATQVASPPSPKPYFFPKVNLATCYQPVVWPLESSDVSWGAVTGVAIDSGDNVWLCTSGSPPVQVYDETGHYLRGWGDNWLSDPHQLRFDRQGHVWVVDAHEHTVQKFTRDGKRLLLIGVPGVPGDDGQHFNEPTDVALTSNGDVFVADGYRNVRVVHFNSNGEFIRSWGQVGVQAGQLNLPHSIVADSQDRLYVAERANGRIQVFDRNGNSLDIWQNLIVPWGLSINPSDELWACGSSPTAWREGDVALGTPPRDQLLIKFDVTGRALQQWFVPKATEGQEKFGQLSRVHCIAEDSHGALYCGDCKANRIIKLERVARSVP